MLYFLNLAFNLFVPGLIEWMSRWLAAPVSVSVPEPDDYAKAIAALAGILILGLGGVLIIGLSGRYVRRWIFKSHQVSSHVSPDSVLEKMDWAKPPGSVGLSSNSSSENNKSE